MKRRHRVMVEVTFDVSVTDTRATRAVQAILDASDTDKVMGRRNFPVEVKRMEAKNAERVIAAEVRKVRIGLNRQKRYPRADDQMKLEF